MTTNAASAATSDVAQLDARRNRSIDAIVQFMESIWQPSDLCHQLGTLDRHTQRFTNSPVSEIDDALRQAKVISASGNDAYLACAAYHTPSNRTAENAAGAFCLFLDIDVGPDKAASGKGYVDIAQATIALAEVCTRAGIPPPNFIVNSGSGLHAYWAFAQFLAKREWLVTARQFKELIQMVGLLADPSRTSDIASVLRFPGTLNYKYDPPRPVTLLKSAPLLSAVSPC